MTAWRESPTLKALPEEPGPLKPGYTLGHKFGLEDFPYAAGSFPSCSRHGAMVRVSIDAQWFRCVEPGCNIGCERLVADGRSYHNPHSIDWDPRQT